MRNKVIFVLAALALAGCQPVGAGEVSIEKALSGYTVADFMVAKKCGDGTEVYVLAEGQYALWRGEDENDQHWIRLAPGVTPDDYCN